MLQLELYVNGVDRPETLLTTVFDFVTMERNDGWRLLRHKDNHDIMLFDPALVKNGVNHWPDMKQGAGGAGIELVLIVEDAEIARSKTTQLGFQCTEPRLAPWGSIEFTFKLKEGYLFRIKQLTKSKV